MSVVARRPHRATRLVGVAAIGALLIATAACSSDDDDGAAATDATTTPATTEPTTTTAVAAETTDASTTSRPSSTTSSSTSSSSTVAPTTAPSGATCVADIPATVARATAEVSLAPLPADLVTMLDAAVQQALPITAAPGAIVGVQTPQGTWTAAYGVADPATGAPMEIGTHTRIGSVTKTFTGTVIEQLAADGLVSLDDTIDQYVANVPNGDRITLRMLADMTSGVASYTRQPAFLDVYFARPETVFQHDQLLQVGLDASPLFEPGAEFDYSNTNTFLLGYVIEKATGKSVQDVFAERIFQPLGLTHTSWPNGSTELPAPYAEGFTLQGDAATPENPSNATHWDSNWAWTAGELISTMEDLLVYGRALGTGGKLLDADAQAARLAAMPAPAAYGIGMGCVDGWVGHAGELPGYNTTVYYDTTADTTVIVQVNSDIPSGDCPEEQATLTDDPGEAACSSPAHRIFVALADALGHPFVQG